MLEAIVQEHLNDNCLCSQIGALQLPVHIEATCFNRFSNSRTIMETPVFTTWCECYARTSLAALSKLCLLIFLIFLRLLKMNRTVSISFQLLVRWITMQVHVH